MLSLHTYGLQAAELQETQELRTGTTEGIVGRTGLSEHGMRDRFQTKAYRSEWRECKRSDCED
jgi:hypothetical protein